MVGGRWDVNYVTGGTEHIDTEDGNCNVCWNVGKPSKFDSAYPQKPKLYIKLQPQKPKDSNLYIVCYTICTW
jgi:hypothetical protein